MKKLYPEFLSDLHQNSSIDDVNDTLSSLEKHAIDIVPWNEFKYKPEVYFSIAYAHDAVFLKFEVQEKVVQALYRRINEPVYKDTCVEFFIALADDAEYYNFEFNCLGTALAAYGKNRDERKFLTVDIIKKIRKQSSFKSSIGKENALVAWELVLVIPVDAFCYHQIDSLKGKSGRVNLYKCGDDLPEPHYLAWNNIQTPKPDFHQSEFFGEIYFN